MVYSTKQILKNMFPQIFISGQKFITIGKYLKLEIFFAIYAMNLVNSFRHLIYHIKFFI